MPKKKLKKKPRPTYNYVTWVAHRPNGISYGSFVTKSIWYFDLQWSQNHAKSKGGSDALVTGIFPISKKTFTEYLKHNKS